MIRLLTPNRDMLPQYVAALETGWSPNTMRPVPWKQRRGYATQALVLMLREARKEGLAEVVISTDPGNVASQRVIEANGGRDREEFTRPAEYAFSPGVRYRVYTPA